MSEVVGLSRRVFLKELGQGALAVAILGWGRLVDALTAEQKAAWDENRQRFLNAATKEQEQRESGEIGIPDTLPLESEHAPVLLTLAEHWNQMSNLEKEIKELGMTDEELASKP